MRSVLFKILVVLSLVSLAVPAAVGSASALPQARSAAPSAGVAPTDSGAATSSGTPVSVQASASQDVAPVELPEQRTANSRTFLMPDGSYQAEVYTAPVHYADADGDWRPIDNTLVPTDRDRYAAENAGNDYRLLVPADAASAPVRVESGGEWVSFAAQGADGAPQVAGDEATIRGGLGPNTRLEYQARNQGVKETIVLSAAPDSPPSYTFDLHTSPGLTPRPAGDGGLELVDATGESAFTVPAPFMTDASATDAGYSTDVDLDLEPAADGWTVTVTPDPGWLADPARVYPIGIDPTVTPTPQSDTWMDENAPVVSHGGGDYIKAGWGNGQARRALLRFNLDDIPANATVSTATLRLYLDATQSTSGLSAEYTARRVNAGIPWTQAATWNTYDGTHAWTTPGGDFFDGPNPGTTLSGNISGYKEFDQTSTVAAFVDGSVENNGFLVRQKPDGASNGVANLLSFWSVNSADDSRWPKLVVDYTEPAVPASAGAGDRDYYTFVTEQLTDKMSVKANVGNGNLLLTANDAKIPGTAGLDLALTRFYNTALATSTDPSGLGQGWSTSLAGSVRLEFPNNDNNRVFFYDVSGHRVRFERNAAGDYIRFAPGLDATLTRPGGTGDYRLEWYSKDVWIFNPAGRLTEMRDQQGNKITFTFDAQNRLSQATDTRGRTAVFSYRTTAPIGMLDTVEIRTPTGTPLIRYRYGYTSTVPARLSSSKVDFVNTSVLTDTADSVNVGALTTYGYDANGRLNQVKDARETSSTGGTAGGTTTFGYSAAGQVNQISRLTDDAAIPDSTSTLTYFTDTGTTTDCNGEGVSRTVVNGERTDVTDTTTYCADTHGRVRRTVDANGNARKSTWTANSNVATFDGSGTGASLTPFTYTYDGSDNPTQTETPSGGTAGMSYTDPANAHLPTEVRSFRAGAGSAGATWSYDYDDNGLLIEALATGPGIRYRYCWDGDGQLQRISPSDPDGTNSLAKDENLTAGCGTANQGNDTLLTYDADGQLTNVNPPGTTQGRDYTYDQLSRVKTMTDGRGIRTTFTYDALDHVTKAVYDDDPAVAGVATNEVITLQWIYDAAGNLTGRIDAGGSSTFTIDELNRRTFEPKAHSLDPLNGITYTYDPADNLTKIEPAQQAATTYTYDKVNLVASVNDPRTDVARATTFGYDQRDHRTRTTYPMPTGDDLVQAAAYDDDGRMKCIYAYRESNDPNVTGDNCPAATTAGLLTFYKYDYRVGATAGGNQTYTRYAMTELGGRVTDYNYDAITRLTKAVVDTAATNPVRQFDYTYDKRSNLTREQVSGTMTGLDTRTTTIAYDNAEQMCWSLRSATSPTSDCATTPAGATTYTYDGAGSLDTATGGVPELNGLNLEYNPVGQTSSIDPAGTAGPVGMGYAGATQDVRFTAGDLRYNNNLLGLSMQSTSSGQTHEETFVRDPDGNLVAMIDRNGPEPDWYYLTDGLGSVMAIVSTTGTVRRYVYEPYGEQLRNFIDQDAASPNNSLDGEGSDPPDTDADFNPYRYASGYYDRATGMLKFGTRYYMPTLTRWTQVDPVAGNPSNPPTLCAYGYVSGDPINATDSAGRDAWTWFDALGAAGAGLEAGWEYWNGDTQAAISTLKAFALGTLTTTGCVIFFAATTGPGALAAAPGCYLLGTATEDFADNWWETGNALGLTT